ncbi:acyltransferase [Pedobacter sp. UBA4863]|uniref:acyltransferase n=1 Tax=Pedobacter sp. UBA4863 TaxID=1947060 RepID=UPI0025F6C63B|nr:acyltransferase [Pedobacter sp. UBA4863]
MTYFVHETAVVDKGAVIGKATKIWHFSHVMAGAAIGENCILGQNVMVASGVHIGNGVKIQNNVSVYSGVAIEDDAFIGPSVVFTNVKNPRSFINRRAEFLSTRIGKGATIGANATVICGNNVGAFALVGAGAVVTKDVKAYAIVVGTPAKQMGWASEYGHHLTFDQFNMATCPESGQQYKLVDFQVIKQH